MKVFKKAEDIICEAEKKINELPLEQNEKNDILVHLALIKLTILPKIEREWEKRREEE